MRDSLRFGLSQLGSRIKTWRWLFAAAAAVLIAVLAWLGYTWVRDNTEWLPQRETVVAYISGSDRERQIAQALGVTGNSLHLYEVALADDFTACTVQAELWTHEEGLVDSWPLLETSSDSRALYGPRRQLLVLSIEARHEAWSEATSLALPYRAAWMRSPAPILETVRLGLPLRAELWTGRRASPC